MFDYRSGPGGLQRFFGTTEGAPHSAWLTSGTHTHIYTVFSKPGRCELTYQTSARGKDGSLITSKPTTTSIQVGGQRPADEKRLPSKSALTRLPLVMPARRITA